MKDPEFAKQLLDQELDEYNRKSGQSESAPEPTPAEQ